MRSKFPTRDSTVWLRASTSSASSVSSAGASWPNTMAPVPSTIATS